MIKDFQDTFRKKEQIVYTCYICTRRGKGPYEINEKYARTLAMAVTTKRNYLRAQTLFLLIK